MALYTFPTSYSTLVVPTELDSLTSTTYTMGGSPVPGTINSLANFAGVIGANSVILNSQVYVAGPFTGTLDIRGSSTSGPEGTLLSYTNGVLTPGALYGSPLARDTWLYAVQQQGVAQAATMTLNVVYQKNQN